MNLKVIIAFNREIIHIYLKGNTILYQTVLGIKMATSPNRNITLWLGKGVTTLCTGGLRAGRGGAGTQVTNQGHKKLTLNYRGLTALHDWPAGAA